jgi:hypothetical protein
MRPTPITDSKRLFVFWSATGLGAAAVFLAALGLAAADPAPQATPASTFATPALATPAGSAPAALSSPGTPAAVAIPAGTRLRFHVDEPLSSNGSKTGQAFGFVLLDPIEVDGRVIAPSGAAGSGTVFLAGHAGNQGHEGDLTLRLDSLNAAADAGVTFADQRFQINGRNRKAAATILGFVPYAGLGAMFIRGSDVRVDPSTPIETVLLRPATFGLPAASPSAGPLPSAPASLMPQTTPSP